MRTTKEYKEIEELVALYELIYSSLPSGILIYDETGQCYFATQKTVSLIGANSLDDVLAQNYHNISSWKKSGLYDIATEAFKSGAVLKHTANFQTSFGKNVWLEIVCKPFESNAKKNLLLMVSDITEIKESEEYYKKKSTFDALTGIHNRAYFNERIEEEIQRCTRSNKPFSLIMIDIDCFKAFNDHYGHLAGDECLKYVAKTIDKSLIRKSDCVARYGGEEFVCFLPYTDTEGALIVSERIKENIREIKIPHAMSSVDPFITISQGICTKQPSTKVDVKVFVHHADSALYVAKKQGRNRIEIYD